MKTQITLGEWTTDKQSPKNPKRTTFESKLTEPWKMCDANLKLNRNVEINHDLFFPYMSLRKQ